MEGGLLADGFYDGGVLGQQVIPAHTGFSGHSAGDYHDITAVGVLPVGGANDRAAKGKDPAGFGHIQSLTLGKAFNDVQKHNIAKIPPGGNKSRRSPDITSPYHCDLLSAHQILPKNTPLPAKNDPTRVV